MFRGTWAVLIAGSTGSARGGVRARAQAAWVDRAQNVRVDLCWNPDAPSLAKIHVATNQLVAQTASMYEFKVQLQSISPLENWRSVKLHRHTFCN